MPMHLQKTLKENLHKTCQFIFFVVRHFFNDDGPYLASALTYTTLLAIVPLMAVSFSILSTFPMFQDLAKPIQDFIFANFVPSTGKIIQNYLINFANQAIKLSAVGMFFLFIVALLMMHTIESAMNRIWRVNASRHHLTAFFLYCGIVSLAPFLLGLSLAGSSYILSLPFLTTHDIPALLHYLPFLFSLTGFTFLYVVVPNDSVKIIHGFYGGLIAALLFEFAKLAFGYYLSHYHTYQFLYGAFATAPIFFIWIYWVWLITLIGAEISYAFAVHHQRRPEPPLDGFSQSLLYLYALKMAKIKGKKGVTLRSLSKINESAYRIKMNEVLEILTNTQLIKKINRHRYALQRDLSQMTLYDLAQTLPYRLPNPKELTHHALPLNQQWKTIIKTTDKQLQQLLTTRLDDFFDNNEYPNNIDVCYKI